MKWYKKLYVGESIAGREAKIKWKIRHNAGQIQIYVISLATNDQNLLDIIPAVELLQTGYPKHWLTIVGLAGGREEAVQLAVSIVSEVYEQTGGFDIRTYLKKRSGVSL